MNEIKSAPEGQIYVCLGCGKVARSVYDFSDVSCALNCYLAYENKITVENGRVAEIPDGSLVPNNELRPKRRGRGDSSRPIDNEINFKAIERSEASEGRDVQDYSDNEYLNEEESP